MACGTPVITVNRAALGEVAHGYSLTMEEPTVPALVEAMRQVLDDPALRSELSRKGLDRARQLRWPEAARRTLDVLRQVAQQ
jgi:glycosyltransferase involved in cell wall biosynthesis